MSIYRDLAEISWCPEYVNLQRFYDTQVCQFTEILHDQAKHVKSLYMVNLPPFLGDFVKSVNYESYPLRQAATIYKHFTNILK